MTAREIDTGSVAGTSVKVPERRDGYLFHPVVDFLCLGGGSLIVLPLIGLLSTDASLPRIGMTTLAISFVVNAPHFAHSYQIFYGNFARMSTRQDYPRMLRLRYVFAGIVVPIVLALFFAAGVATTNAAMLGFGANIMFFFVGWHYTKQGYGMIIVDSVLKRQFFAASEKRILLLNSYAVWSFSWLLANQAVAENNYLGLKYYTFGVPPVAMYAVACGTAITSVMVAYVLGRRMIADGGRLPVSGVFAYLATLYVWMFARLSPAVLLVVPAFHSLQYLVVVWRYQLNVYRDRADASEKPSFGVLAGVAPSMAVLRLYGFFGLGVVLGCIGFWIAPVLLGEVVAYDRETFGGGMFLFIFWIFINVHHYFLDNVMWRRDNPSTRKYLFARP